MNHEAFQLVRIGCLPGPAWTPALISLTVWVNFSPSLGILKCMHWPVLWWIVERDPLLLLSRILSLSSSPPSRITGESSIVFYSPNFDCLGLLRSLTSSPQLIQSTWIFCSISLCSTIWKFFKGNKLEKVLQVTLFPISQ